MRYVLDIKKCKFIGKGHEGRVYLTPEGFALKIFYKSKNANDEVEILEKVKNSRFFPNVLFIADKMVLREYISGENLGSYLYKHGLSYNIAVEIIELVEEFKKLKQLIAHSSNQPVRPMEKPQKSKRKPRNSAIHGTYTVVNHHIDRENKNANRKATD